MSGSRRDWLAESAAAVSTALTRHGIWHTLAFGTLLGAVREQDIIEWDYDIDFLIRPADIPRILTLNADLARDRVQVSPVYMSSSVLACNPGGVATSTGPRLIIRYDGHRTGDMYAFSLFSDGVVRWYDFHWETYWCPESSFPHYFVESLETVFIRGRAYPAPRAPEKWLEGIYGETWRTPFKPGDPRSAALNVWGYRFRPKLAEEVAWCESQGWRRDQYAGEPAWPRQVWAVGPEGWAPDNEDPGHVRWWRSLDDIVRLY
jgi:hypothetical protein